VYELSTHWKPTFTLPENGPKGFEETVYYIDYQGTRLISLNSPAFLAGSEADSAAQVGWLESILENNQQKWTIVTAHHPVFSTKYGRNNARMKKALIPLFEKYHVDLVLQGHDHTYGRGTNVPIGKGRKPVIEGPMYIVSVSGPKMYDIGLDEWIQRGASNTQLYQIIKVDGDVLRFEAYTLDDQLYDAFELKKKSNGKTIFLEKAPEDVIERLEIPTYFKSRVTEEQLKAYQSRFDAYMKRKKSKK
jgi:hypothetical protein